MNMLDIRGTVTVVGQSEPSDECYAITEGSPWDIDEFCDMLRGLLKDFEAGKAGVHNGTKVLPTILDIQIRRLPEGGAA